jgi:hypothetical protein
MRIKALQLTSAGRDASNNAARCSLRSRGGLSAHFAQSERPFRSIVITRFGQSERGVATLDGSSLRLGFLLPSGRSL